MRVSPSRFAVHALMVALACMAISSPNSAQVAPQKPDSCMSVEEFGTLARQTSWYGVSFQEGDYTAPILYRDLMKETPGSDAEHQKALVLLTYSWGQTYVCHHALPLLNKLRSEVPFGAILNLFAPSGCGECFDSGGEVSNWAIQSAAAFPKTGLPDRWKYVLTSYFLGCYRCRAEYRYWEAVLHLMESERRDKTYLIFLREQIEHSVHERGMTLSRKDRKVALSLCDQLLNSGDLNGTEEEIKQLRQLLS